MDLQHYNDTIVLNLLDTLDIDHIYLVLILLNVLFVDLCLKIYLIQYRAIEYSNKKKKGNNNKG